MYDKVKKKKLVGYQLYTELAKVDPKIYGIVIVTVRKVYEIGDFKKTVELSPLLRYLHYVWHYNIIIKTILLIKLEHRHLSWF